MLLPREKERNTVSKKRAVRKIFRDVFFGGQELIMVGKKEERVARRRRDVTSDARRFLSRIGRRLRYSLSLSVWRASFSWKSVVRAPNGDLKISTARK